MPSQFIIYEDESFFSSAYACGCRGQLRRRCSHFRCKPHRRKQLMSLISPSPNQSRASPSINFRASQENRRLFSKLSTSDDISAHSPASPPAILLCNHNLMIVIHHHYALQSSQPLDAHHHKSSLDQLISSASPPNTSPIIFTNDI
ncbi:unnamed protein product [Microthlaspi erraticum]|uniref:Uncharacterized protein n=1 Tax=Microthlaspi erraticum TaxID=1685480 RepID=A0A6D2I987_9BRAS|nr:unnamed protein product [Microthlaspi erraticum]